MISSSIISRSIVVLTLVLTLSAAGLGQVTVECFAPLFAGTIDLKLFTYGDASGSHGTTANVSTVIPAGITGSQKAALIEAQIHAVAPWITVVRYGSTLVMDTSPGLDCTGAVDATGEICLVENDGIGVPVTYRTRVRLSGSPSGGGKVVFGENGNVREIPSTTGMTVPQIYLALQGLFGEGFVDADGFSLPARTTTRRWFSFEVTDPGLVIDVSQDMATTFGATFSASVSVAIVDPDTTTYYSPTGFSGTARSIRWDPLTPTDYIIGGDGSIGRASLIPPVMSYGPITTTTVGTASQMSWSLTGKISTADSASNQVIDVDPSSGATTPVTSGPQPWGMSLHCGARQPVTDDFYAGSFGRIDRVASGSMTAMPFVSGLGGLVSGITFDPASGDVLAIVRNTHRVIRISLAGAVSDVVPAGTVLVPAALDIDGRGRLVVGSSFGQVYEITLQGDCHLLATLTGPGNLKGLSVKKPLANPGFRLRAQSAGGGLVLSMAGIPQGTTEGWTFLSFDTSLPIGAGPQLGFNADLTTFNLLLAVPTAIPGNPVHWTWPSNDYPAAPFALPPGSLPAGTPMDFIGLAIGAQVVPTQVERVTL